MLKSEDKLKIEIFGMMTPSLHASFQMLYQPLIGKEAACLYEVLYAVAIMNAKIKNHRILPELTGQSIELIEKNRVILEQYLLMKTFYNGVTNKYIYQILMPKKGNEFLAHEVFGRMYLNAMGKQVYEFNKLTFSYTYEDKEDYVDCTIPFENILEDTWNEKLEESFEKMKPEDTFLNDDVPINFNYDLFLSTTSHMVFPANERNSKNLKLIGELATIYGIGIKDMRQIVGQSIDLKTSRLNVAILKEKARTKKVIFTPSSKPLHELSPIEFLKQKQHGIDVSKTDRLLIETLLKQFKLKPDVVNALIEYVLKTNNQNLRKNYVEKIAGTWVRLQIDTYEKALAHIEKLEKKDKKTKDKQLPDWVIEDEPQVLVEETFDEDELRKELDNMRRH